MSGAFAIATKLGGRRREFAFEGTVESGFGVVADCGGDFRDALLSGLKEFCAEFEAPFGEIGYRRFVQEMGEATGKARAREADAASQSGNGPVLRGILVKQSKRLADDGIASSGEPTDLVRRQRANVAAQSFDEKKF